MMTACAIPVSPNRIARRGDPHIPEPTRHGLTRAIVRKEAVNGSKINILCCFIVLICSASGHVQDFTIGFLCQVCDDLLVSSVSEGTPMTTRGFTTKWIGSEAKSAIKMKSGLFDG
jgi:hypothetical protein